MNLMESAEAKLFEFQSATPLSAYERYAPCRVFKDDFGQVLVCVIGSRGSEVTLICNDFLPEEPFVILRSFPPNGTYSRYQAITLSDLESLLEFFFVPVALLPTSLKA